MRWLTPLIAMGLMWTAVPAALPQNLAAKIASPSSLGANQLPVVEGFQFLGLRRITPAAVNAQLTLRAGDPLDAARLHADVCNLGRLGWFSSIRVEEVPLTTLNPDPAQSSQRVTLVFHLHEQPILSRVEYSGSRLLSTKQIGKLLEDKNLSPALGKPADPAVLQRIAQTIRAGLAELAHPEAAVQIRREIQKNSTVTVHFEVIDGPHLPVREVRFEGDPQLSEKVLRKQMQSIAPWMLLASLRGKDAYTVPAFEDDRRRLLAYYLDHGYPEARIGKPEIRRSHSRSRILFPVPRRAERSGLQLSIPVQSGPSYHFDTIDASSAVQLAIESANSKLPTLLAENGRPFSQSEIDKLRRYYSALLFSRSSNSLSEPLHFVEATPSFDSEDHSVRLHLTLSDSPPYLVRHLDFQGLHKFSDRFVRRRIPLREGQPIDEHALEVGLTKLARTGYFKPIRQENVHIQFNDARRTADVVVRLEEIGQQRATFEGGRAQFGSTIGIIYTVFDLFNHEELLSAKLDGGPEALQVALGIAKEGIFGTRGSLAFSLFDNVLRPRLIHGVQGPFPATHTLGASVPYTYTLTTFNSVGLGYTLSRTTSDQVLTAPAGTTVPPLDLRTGTTSSALGTSWAYDRGNARLLFSDSVSGGILGGDEHMLRSSLEAARIFRDPLFSSSNALALRGVFNAAGSYRGDAPFSSRFFSGDEFVRGLSTGELGPIALNERFSASSPAVPTPAPAGANVITAANAEYRIPIRPGVQASGFFDLGAGWLLPNWLGPSKPMLLGITNGVLHGSTGVELSWTVPGIDVPIRSYYAINALRLDRLIPLSGKSILHAHNRFAAFGWGFGPLF